jgi:hypothetical protein
MPPVPRNGGEGDGEGDAVLRWLSRDYACILYRARKVLNSCLPGVQNEVSYYSLSRNSQGVVHRSRQSTRQYQSFKLSEEIVTSWLDLGS